MSVRIRYSKQGDLLTSTRVFQAEDSTYKVTLNSNQLTFQIIDLTTNNIADEGGEHSLHELKKSAKQALVNLGVSFNDEFRLAAKRHQELSKTLGDVD